MGESDLFFTPQDRSSAAYAACVGGMGMVGATVGRFGGLHGLLLGAAVGVGYGLLACKKLSPIIEKKLLSNGDRLTESELATLLALLRQQAGVTSRGDGMYVIAQVRHAAALNKGSFETANTCAPMSNDVKALLTHRPSAA